MGGYDTVERGGGRVCRQGGEWQKRRKKEEREVRWVGKMECRSGWGDSWERRGEWWWWGGRGTHTIWRGTHTPCGGLTEAMWDCSWNNKQRDVSGGLEDRELLTCGPALSSRLDSATERTRNDLSCCSLSTRISFFFWPEFWFPICEFCAQVFWDHLCASDHSHFFFSLCLCRWRDIWNSSWSWSFLEVAQTMAGVKMLPLSGLEHSSQRHCPVYVCIRQWPSHTQSSLFGLEAANT